MSTAFIIQVILQDKVLEDINAEVKSFRYRESLYGTAIYSLHIVSPDFKKYESLVTAGENIDLRLRWFYEGDDKRKVYDNWKIVKVGKVKFRYSPTSLEVIVHGTDSGIVLSKACHNNVFYEKRISEMIAIFAKQNRLKHSVKQTLNTHTLYQCDMTDGQFIKDILQPLAVDVNGNGGYNFFIENGDTLVFEPPSLVLSKELDSFSLYKDIQSLDVEYNDFAEAYDGTNSLELRGFDTAQKVPVHYIANDNAVIFKKLAPYAPTPPKLPSRIRLTTLPPVGKISNSMVKEEATAIWSLNARSLFRTQLELPSTIGIKIGETAMVEAKTPSGEIFFPHGAWLIYSILQYRNEVGKSSTILYLERRTWN